jgi:NTE family protein
MKRYLLIALFLFLTLIQVNAQSVGLVLSGGGAKGMAHIAVIRVLEENNIPIDYIAGTSIGAIVGGLYAAGYTPDEMEELFKSDDFYFWSTGKIQREYRYYFKRPEPEPSWLTLRVARKEEKIKVLPPTNIIPADQMDFAFMELTAATSAACNYNFDSLMVPFFCVAADVNASEPVVLRSGDLGNSIRASMTVPLYFKPIQIDGRLMFDGGLLNNFPTEYMKDIYNPDIIIGHKVANNAKAADPDDLMQQISNMVMRPTNFEIDAEDGILLETKFEDVGLLDFNKADLIIEKGQETAMNALDSIKHLVNRRVSKEEIDKKRSNFNVRKPALYFQNIQVEGVSDPMQRQFIIQSIKHRSDVITLKNLKKEYFKLIADDNLKSIEPLTYYNPNTGYFDLHLRVELEKKFDVNFGGNLSTKPINQGFASFNYRSYHSRAYNLYSNLYFGRFYSSAKFGGRIDYSTRLPFYLSYYFTMNRWDYYASSTELFFENVRPPYIIQDELNMRLESGLPLGLHTKLSLGLSYSSANDEFYRSEDFAETDKPDNSYFKGFSARIGFENNSLNFKQYATEGSWKSIGFRTVSGNERFETGTIGRQIDNRKIRHNYIILNGKVLNYFKLSNFFSLGTQIEASISNKDLFKTFRSAKLSAPGFQPTPHSKSLFIEQFHSNNFLAGGLKTIFKFSPEMHLRMEGYAFLPIKEELLGENLMVYKNDQIFENYYLQGAAALVYQTGVGPVSLSVNYYEKEDTKVYVTLNFGYILFNKRGL